MSRRIVRTAIALAAAALVALAACAATFRGRNVDDHWYEGRATSTTYGSYECRIKFHGDHVYFVPQGTNIQVVCLLDEELIVDEHDIIGHDPRRGVDWSIDCFNLGQ